jgi:hypothetical protein
VPVIDAQVGVMEQVHAREQVLSIIGAVIDDLHRPGHGSGSASL